MTYTIIPCVAGDDAFVAQKLNDITDAMINYRDTIEDELVVFKVTDDEGNIIAGCNLLIDCLRVADLDILWVQETYRGRGIGSALIHAAEKAAWERGCTLITLGTFDFQARPLYEKHGYTVSGVIEDCPTKGHTHYDMMKKLRAPLPDIATHGFTIRIGTEEDAEYIDDMLCEYNLSQIPRMRDFEQITGKITRANGNLIAAAFADVNFWNLAFIDMLWVDEDARRQGIGSHLLADVEQKLKNAGARMALVFARDWNADFFQKCGYTTFCTLKDYPTGYNRYQMLKRL